MFVTVPIQCQDSLLLSGTLHLLDSVKISRKTYGISRHIYWMHFWSIFRNMKLSILLELKNASEGGSWTILHSLPWLPSISLLAIQPCFIIISHWFFRWPWRERELHGSFRRWFHAGHRFRGFDRQAMVNQNRGNRMYWGLEVNNILCMTFTLGYYFMKRPMRN